MSTSTKVEKPITRGQKEHLEKFKRHHLFSLSMGGQGYMEVDDPEINLLTIRALEHRKLIERDPSGGTEWDQYRITEKGLMALDDPESVISLTPDMVAGLKKAYEWHLKRGAEWVNPWTLNTHENTMRALLKRGLLEAIDVPDTLFKKYRITEKGIAHIERMKGIGVK